MQKVKMIANRRFEYAARVLNAGDHFQADSEGHAALLCHNGFARRDVEAETISPGKRQYRRRDMRADG